MTPGWADIAGATVGVARAGLYAGARDDVALLVAPGVAAAVTTRSTAAASSCRWTRARVPGPVHALVVNAGNANAATGPEGAAATRAMAEAVSSALGCPTDQVLVCSTGVIGVPLPIELVSGGIARAAGALGAPGLSAARAIMTTDTAPKEAGALVDGVAVAGIAKGSGMIHPDMATMLAFVVTDADVDAAPLQALVESVTARTFNAVSVDGDMSTNDTFVVQATGRGRRAEPGTPAWTALAVALEQVCRELARAIASDGEGASRLLTVEVCGLVDDATARAAARAIARSPLVKTAVHGCDPNWGRVVGALGAFGVPDLDSLDLDFAGTAVLRGGRPVVLDEASATAAMEADEVIIRAALPGPGRGTAWGCDLSAGYVAINADYRS